MLRLTQLFPLFSALLLTGIAMAQDASAPASADSACPMQTEGHCACKHKGHHADGAEHMDMFNRMGDELGLSDTQKQELATLIEMYRPRMQELAERGAESADEVLQLAPDDPTYSLRATELSSQAGTSAAEMVTLMTELQSNAYALLTSDQQTKFMTLRAEQRARMEQRKAEMKARRASGEYGPGMHSGKQHKCQACDWLDEQDAAEANAE